jgi:hypothetical protein
MILTHEFQHDMWQVIRSEQLTDLSQFHRPNFHDEVPLYSRYEQLVFLRHLSIQDIDQVLIAFSVRFLRAVVSYQETRTPYFAAITVWNLSDHEAIVPSLFFWSGQIKPLKQALSLKPVVNDWGKRLQNIVEEEDMSKKLLVLQDVDTEPGVSRVFISYKKPPYKAFVPLGRFQEKVR